MANIEKVLKLNRMEKLTPQSGTFLNIFDWQIFKSLTPSVGDDVGQRKLS